MKKFLTLALCIAAIGSINAQKANQEAAKKLSGKLDKLEEARATIEKAIENPETAQDVYTYYLAGKIEYDAFDKAYDKMKINPEDPAADKYQMGKELMNGFDYFIQAFPLDQIPNEKGQVKPKYTKDMASRISGNHGNFWAFGGEMYNNKHYYPEAYQLFSMYGDLPSYDWASKEVKVVPDTTLALAYYYAGLSAYSANELKDAAKALKKSRLKGVTDPQALIYEIATWQNMIKNDSTLIDESKMAIEEIATDGFNRFGMEQPIFITNLIASKVDNEKYDDAFAIVNQQISKNPDNPVLYALRAYIYERSGDDEKTLEDYLKAASYDTADADTYNRAARRLYNHGSAIWNAIEGNEPAKRQEVKTKYWEKAKELAEKALAKDPGNPQAEQIIESVDYALETYFK